MIKAKAFIALILALCLLNSEVYGKPDPQLFEAGTLALAGVAIANSQRCGETAGCHKGYCWTYCGLSFSSGEWCYTKF